MTTLYHSPFTRSTRILWLLEELGARDAVTIHPVQIQRSGQPGGPDPQNPHPEGKVPALAHQGALLTESGAIMLLLTDLFPQAGLGRAPDHAQRGAYLNWLFYAGGVIEPVLTQHVSDAAPDPLFTATFRGYDEMSARLDAALAQGPYLLGQGFSAADLLIVAPFIWFPAMAPQSAPVQRWISACAARPAFARVSAEDEAMAAG